MPDAVDHTETWIVVEAPGDGAVHVSSQGGGHIAYEPEMLSRVLRVCRQAQAVALTDRGRW